MSLLTGTKMASTTLLITILVSIVSCGFAVNVFRNHHGERVLRSVDRGPEYYKKPSFLPVGYDANQLPKPAVGPLTVRVSVLVLEVRDIDEKNEHIAMEFQLRALWHDLRLGNGTGHQKCEGDNYTVLNLDNLKDIWYPDIFIEHVKHVDIPEILSKTASLRLYPNGCLRYSTRITVTVSCSMNFKYYPADTQRCQIDMQSYAYKRDQLTLKWNWNQVDGGSQLSIHARLANFALSLGDERRFKFAKHADDVGHSGLSCYIILKRYLGSHILQTYLPSTIYLVVSWLSFILPMESASEKMGYCVACLFTLTTSFSAIRHSTPNVQYAKALDVWMIGCIVCVFLTLVQHAIISKVRRTTMKQQVKRQTSQHSQQTRMIWLPHPECTMADDKMEETIFAEEGSPNAVTSGQNNVGKGKNKVLPNGEGKPKHRGSEGGVSASAKMAVTVYEKLTKRANLYISLVIPTLFFLFNVVYWAVVLSVKDPE